jgi:hypothetical protein
VSTTPYLHKPAAGTQPLRFQLLIRSVSALCLLCLFCSLRTFLQLEQLPLLSTSLTSLALRCHPSRATPKGRWHLTALSSLRQLSCCPVGQGLSSEELQRLMDMPQLQQLTLGLKDASQVGAEHEVASSNKSQRKHTCMSSAILIIGL